MSKILAKLGRVWLFMSLPFVLSRASAADPRFDKIVEDYFAARFEFRPSEGTAAGLHEYDHRLEDLSRERATRRIHELMQFQQRFAALERDLALRKSKLPADDDIDLIFLQRQVEAELLDLNVIREWAQTPWATAGLPGNAIDLLIKRDFAPPAERLRAVVAREKQIPAIFEAARANLTEPPREFTDLAIRMAKGSLGFFSGKWSCHFIVNLGIALLMNVAIGWERQIPQ